MPASPNLFKVLTAEDPKSLLEDEIGCMTGIFQIFDRSQAFTGRRYGSKRVTSAADQSLSVSACESPRYDHSSSNPYWMKVDNNLEQSKGAVDHQSRDHHRAYSDSSDIFTKSFKAQGGVGGGGGGGGGVLDRHLTDQKDHNQFAEQELSNSQEGEDHVPTLVCSNSSQEEEEEESNNSNRLMKSVQDLVVDRSSSSVPHSKEYPKPPPLLVVSSREMCAAAATPEGSGGSSRQHCNSKDVQKLPSSLDIRDVVRASFHRERPRDSSGKEKPRASVDLGHGSSRTTTNVQSKSLPRSSSVNGRVDGFQMSVDGREELLWSSSASAVDHARSTGGRGSRMLVGDWKNGLQNSSTVESTLPQMSAALREKDNFQSSSKVCVDGGRELPRISVDRNCFTKHSSCPAIDGKDHAAAATRLTVELKEDPRLSVSKDERQGGVFVDARDHHQYYSSPRLLLPGLNAAATTTTTVRYPHESKDPSTTTTTTAAAFDFRESLRAADFKDLLRASQKVRGNTTDAPRFSVDGTRDPPHVHLSPRLSVDGRDSPRACRIPPRLKLDGRDATRAHGKLSSRSDGGGGAFLQLKKENNAAERDHQGQGEARRRIPNVVARLMGLEELPSSDPGSQAHPAKVADYHTLVNPPSSSSSSSSSRSEARLLQGLLQYTPATVVSPPLPPPPSQSDDYNYKQQQVVVREGFQQLSSKSSSCSNQKEMRVPLPSHLHHLQYYGGEEEEIPLQYPPPLEERFWIHHAQEKSRDHPEVKSPTHHQVQYHPHDEAFQEQRWQHLSSQTPAPQLSDHVVLTALKHTDEEKTTQPLSEEEPLYGLMDQEMHQLRLKNSVQGRKLLRHILHAMQLKGLLHHPPGRNRKQSSEDVKAAAAATQQQQQLQVPKATTVEESKSRMQALKQQFLPSPRLTTAAVRKRGNSLVPAETCKDNKDNKKTVATQQQEDQQHHLPMMMTMETNLLQELVINSSNEEQINSCCSVQQDDGPIMLGNIPDTLIIVPKPITEMEDDNIITTAITTLSSSSPPVPAQTGDLDCVSSQSSSSARSAVTSSVQTSTETEYPQSSSTCSNGTVATMTSKRENGDAAAANGRTSRVQTPSSSGSSSLREPNGSSSSDTEAVTVVTPRMSRKERIAARSSKSSQLDAAAAASQGGGRDVSPARSPRLLTSSPPAQVGKPRLTFLIKEANPLKPGLLSPGRCAGGGSSSGPPQLVESSGSKASSWSTKSFMVKDREETKATLFTLRAQSTKQEFLKGRASGGPDTPRPLRRSSSDSKLISRITEKLTATDAAAAAAAVSTRTAAAQAGGAQGGRILIPAEVTISRSKRKTGKPNNPTPKCRTSSSSSSSSSSSPSSCALDTTTETLVSAAAADPSTKEKINKFPNGVTGPAVMAVAADEHTNWDQSNDSDLMMLESIQCANIALAESRLLELPTATTVMPENLVTTSKNVSSVRKALRVTSAEKLELLQATSIQKPSMPIAVEDTVNHGEEDRGGDSHAHLASNQVTSCPIGRLCKSELDAELDERETSISEVLTPRGVSVKKKYEFGHELGSADQLVEQPSPVSVLDNFHFQEEDLTPSPSKTSSSTLDSLQDAFDESLHRDHLEEAKAALKGLADIRSRDLCNQQQDYLCHNNKQSVEIQVPIDNAQQARTHCSLAGNNNTVVHGICLWSKDEEREYVRDMLVVSRVITEDDDDDDDTSSSGINNCRLQWGRSSGYNNIMDVNQFNDLEARWRRRQQQQASSFNNTKENDFFLFERRQTCLENEAAGRRVLFDGTNEILVQKLDPVKFNPLPWIGGRDRPQPQEKPSGQQLIQQVWDELQDVPCVASEDVCDTLYTILHKDLRNTEKKWSDMDGEVSEVSLDLERMIVKDLIDEIVKDLTVQATTTPTTTTTQLIDEVAAAATR